MQRPVGLDKQEVPLHFEGVPLRPWVMTLGWPVAAICVVVGIAVAARATVFAIEGIGVVLAGVGGTLVVALIRCRRFETVVTARLLTVGAGPLRQRLPIGFVEHIESRSATSWRRLYADRELILHLQSGRRTVPVPSRDPEELLSVIDGARGP